MSIQMVVTNQTPVTEANIPQPLLHLFQEYMSAQGDQVSLPFKHQAEAFRLMVEDREVLLVAGTAAGKTLAIAVPLFHKLRTGRIRKVLLMYPTIALMEDQRQVMHTLGGITGLEIGQLQGGMSRTELVAALNKPIILATPDEVYWFFRKNVKYSSLLIYGLALVDEFVLDEAHLFPGLMLRNLVHLKQRVQLLAERLGNSPRWHVLTATPSRELRCLTGGVEVQGQSKCGDVAVTFLEPVTNYAQRQEKLLGAIENALAEGAKKVLLVFNSADLAHRVFEEIKGKPQPDLPMEVKWRFGRVCWGALKAWLDKEGFTLEIVREIEEWLKYDKTSYLRDLPDGVGVPLPTERLAAQVARLLEAQGWILKRLVYAVTREESYDLVGVIEGKLSGKGRLSGLLWESIKLPSSAMGSIEAVVGTLDRWLSDVQSALERIWTEKGEFLLVTAPTFPEIRATMHEAGMTSELAESVIKHLKHVTELPQEAVARLAASPKELVQRPVALSWLEWRSREKPWGEVLTERLQRAVGRKELEVETRHIATWKESGVPVVIYTGKMAKFERKGLIEAFAALPHAVLISTPAVEVGVDFAAETLITEQCDGNAFLQRFGRVGRRPSIQGQLIVLVKDGETYVRLYRKHQPQMTREAFSHFIANSEDGMFPARLYTEGSAFLDATHWLVNTQLGQIGHWLNHNMFGEGEAAELAREMRAVGLPFAYGLRGTLPGVSLRGGAGGGEPFYILRKVPNDRLFSTDSPFEMAQADMWYVEFLWRKALWPRIVVDAKATLESSQAIFWWQAGRWHLQASYGIAADYVRLFHPRIERNLRGLEVNVRKDLAGLLNTLRPHAANPKVRPLLRMEKALRLFFEPHARFILGQGDVYLLRTDQDDIASPVEDALGNPLALSDQLWLLLYGYNCDEARKLLSGISALNLEEVIYDWGTPEIPDSLGVILLDRVAGACFDIYRRLAKHVGE
ncbi:MAG: DEAD/DEAH box helicase [Anaerolineae bacterium]